MAQQPQAQASLQSVQQSVKAILDLRKKQLTAILSSTPRAERLIVSGLIAVAEMKDKDQQPIAHLCDPVSIARAITQAALLEIDLTSGLGEGWLIKYGNQCTLSIGYRAWQRAAQSGGFDVAFDVVREGDQFEFKKFPAHLSHSPALDGNRGDIRGAYAVASKDGRIYSVEWCTPEDIEQARKSSKSANGPAWNNWEDRMARKLPLTRLVKDLPLDWTGRNGKLREVDEIAERGGGYDVDFDDPTLVIEGGQKNALPAPEAAPQSKTQALLESRKPRVDPAHEQAPAQEPAKQEAPKANGKAPQADLGF